MKAQKPAEGILLHRNYGDAKVYEIACDCQDGDHSHKVWIEADDCGVSLTTYTTQFTPWWEEAVQKRYDIDNTVWQEVDWFCKDLINGIWRRVKLTWTLWTKGYIKYESTLVMTQQQSLNYAETIKSAINDVEEFRKQRNEQIKSR